MPDTSQSPELIQSRTLNPRGLREIETLEILQPPFSLSNSEIDVAFLIDVTGSMDSRIAVLAASLGGIAAGMQEEFSGIRFALVTFKDEDYLVYDTAKEFVNLAAFQALVDDLTSGGGDDIEEAGNYAVAESCAELNWRSESSVFRSIVLITDAPTHERGHTEVEAIAALAAADVRFYNCDYGDDPTYIPLAAASGGQFIQYDDDPELLTANIVAALINVETYTGNDPIYLVNDTVDLVALDEDGNERTFLTRAFGIGVSGEGTSGVRTINITIDNADLEVSRYLASAIKHNLPLEVVYRLYLSNDSTQPQNIPPLRVFLSNVEISGSTVSGELNWFDLSNAPFPNSYYTRDRFPTLG